MTVRRDRHDEAAELRIRARLFIESTAGRSRPPRSRPINESPLKAEAVEEHARRGKALLLGEREDSRGAPDLAGAWVAMHRLLYGVDPVEAVSQWSAIVSTARRTLVTYFDGDVEGVLDLIRFVGGRFRAANGSAKSRMSWKFVFSASAVTDFRVARSRTK